MPPLGSLDIFKPRTILESGSEMLKKRKHNFDFEGAQFSNEYLDGEPKIFESIEAAKKAKERGREKFWASFLVGLFIIIMLIVLLKQASEKPPFPPSGETEKEYYDRIENVKRQLNQ